jgi:hypothetical protein
MDQINRIVLTYQEKNAYIAALKVTRKQRVPRQFQEGSDKKIVGEIRYDKLVLCKSILHSP